MKNLDILKENLKSTSFNNIREDKGILYADFYGKIIFPIGDGRFQPYDGTTKVKLDYILPKLLNEHLNFGHDQDAFVRGNIDFTPLD